MATVLRKGSKLGKYRLDRRLGQGSFADVWKARDLVEGVNVALKIAHPAAVKEWGRAAIEQEARIATRLRHPNIVAARNADWVDGHFTIATDLAKSNLAEYRLARRSAKTALRVIREVAQGLGHAHGQRVLHRDVKPENIMIFADGRAALGDFGASRFAAPVTRAYTEAGTFGYIAPEQAYGRARFSSDVFSLGLIAYEILTGFLPTWPFEWPPERYRTFTAKVPEPVRPVLRKAAQFDPGKRYADARQFSEALERAFARSGRARADRAAPPPQAARTRSLAARGLGRGVPARARARSRAALPLSPLRRSDRGADGPLPVVRQRRQLVHPPDQLDARVSGLREGRTAGVEGVPVVLCGALRGQRTAPTARPEGGARVQHARLRGSAAPVHALLPAVQAQGETGLVAPRPAGPLPALSLADVARLFPLLSVVRAARAARGELPREIGQAKRTTSQSG